MRRHGYKLNDRIYNPGLKQYGTVTLIQRDSYGVFAIWVLYDGNRTQTGYNKGAEIFFFTISKADMLYYEMNGFKNLPAEFSIRKIQQGENNCQVQ